jgi:D-psicose/D-tagatose/L-ribulose 3-epimerase
MPTLAFSNSLRAEPLDETIARLARYGYEGLEMVNADYGERDVERLRTLLADARIECTAVVALMAGARDLSHPDPYLRRAAVAYLKDTVDLVEGLEGQSVTVPPSAIGKRVPLASLEDERRWCVEALREAQFYAGERGIRLGLEACCRYETYFVNRACQALDIAREVGDGCGVVLDTFHMNIEEGDIGMALADAGSDLVGFHVADNNRLPPGKGQIDWRRISIALREANYRGAITVEFRGPTAARLGVAMSQGHLTVSEDEYDGLVEFAADFVRREFDQGAGH